MFDVFLSCTIDDKERVGPLVQALREEGFTVWWFGDVKGGDPYMEMVEDTLVKSRCAVICWSRGALRAGRDWVRGEAEKARCRGAAISVLLDEIELPTPFNVRQGLTLTQWNGDRSDEAFRRLVEGIEAKKKMKGPLSDGQGRGRRKKRALLVGVGYYESGFPELPAARRDVDDLGRILQQPACGFEVTSLRDPDKQEIESALEDIFRGARPGELILFYYTGHVLLIDAKSLHLTARNSKLRSLTSTSLALSSLGQNYLDHSSGAQVLIVLDACYGDGRADAGRGDVAREKVDAALKTCLGSDSSKVVVASGAGPGTGPEAWKEKHSLFTRHLVRALDLDRSKVDRNKDEVLTGDELIHYLDEVLGRGAEGLRPLFWDADASSAQMEIRGRGEASIELPPEATRFVAMLAPELDLGKIIPFFGDGIYGEGPLSFSFVAEALAGKAGLGGAKRHDIGIATAAESLEAQWGDRSQFLAGLRAILTEQAAACDPPAAHDLVLDLKAPWLVVTVNYDDLLEHRLAEADRPYVLISHVLRSLPDPDGSEDGTNESDHAGKILVIRSENHPEVKRDRSRAAELCTSDSIDLKPDDCVIYKLLGSPFINELPFARERRLDTVAITETDHVNFLSKLRNQGTTVPRTFASRWFRTKKLLFLEYNLDVWHYRLIGHVFRKSDAGNGEGSIAIKPPYVVRRKVSEMEKSFWKRLNPDWASMDLTTLIRALRNARSPAR